MPSATPSQTMLSPSSPLRSFLEELKHQTQINCIEIQCDNARRPAFCFHKYNCCCNGQGLLSRKNNSMPDMMKSRGYHGKRENKHDHHSRSHSSKTKLKRPTSMPNIRSATRTNKTDHMISRWTGGECDTRPILNAYWSGNLSSCSDVLSPKSPTTCLRQIQDFPPNERIPLYQQHRLPDYTRALDLVRQKYTTTTNGTCSTSRSKMPKGGKGKRSSHRTQKRVQPLKCEESLIPPVRRQSIEEEDDDLSDGGDGGVVLRMVLPLTVGSISP